MLPRDYKPGKRVPLVIQGYWYYKDYFLPDGPHDGTSDAAQSLVARGFAVLQLDTATEKPPAGFASIQGTVSNTPREGPAYVEKIDAAVAMLADRGIVDPTRVGVTGFSRGGFNAYQLITRPGKIQIAAVVIDDSFKGSYPDLLTTPGNYKTLYAGSFWDHKQSWLDLETSMNIDRVRTPALFAEHNSENLKTRRYDYSLAALQTSNAFYLNKKPFEYLFFPDGAHHLQRPKERLALYAAVVDWMCFWLQGKLPADPDRADRWKVLRTQQEAVLAELEKKGEKVASLPPL